MPKTKFSSAFLTSLIQNEQVAILSFRVLFLAHVDTLAHSGPAKEYRIAVSEHQKVSKSGATLWSWCQVLSIANDKNTGDTQ
jgi:hypothetical protein